MLLVFQWLVLNHSLWCLLLHQLTTSMVSVRPTIDLTPAAIAHTERWSVTAILFEDLNSSFRSSLYVSELRVLLFSALFTAYISQSILQEHVDDRGLKINHPPQAETVYHPAISFGIVFEGDIKHIRKS
jgi:hypothetical protein